MESNGKKSDVKWIVIVILALGLVAVWLLYKEGFLGKKDDRPSVLLITLDGVRFDRLGCAGYSPDVTPNINGLARSGALFSQCTTPAPVSLAATASLLTATDPYIHGVRYSATPPIPLGEGHTTLAEFLSDEGYPTAARVTMPFAFQEYGLDQGIWPSNFIDPEAQNAAKPSAARRGPDRGRQKRQFDAKDVADSTITWLRGNGDKPFFFWAHITDGAAPFMAPEPFGSAHEKDPYMGDLAWVDEQVGRILAEVEHLGIRENTLVVLASCFGEGLGDRIEILHSWFLYDCTTRVPLIFSWPGRIKPEQTFASQIRLIDAAPTILDILGLDAKADAQGKSLLPLIDGLSEDLALTAYSETFGPYFELGYFPLRSIRKGGWKYVHAPKPELYNLETDPSEKKNLAAEEPERVETLREELFTLVIGSPTLPEIDPTAAPALTGGEGLDEAALLQIKAPDPKDHAREIINYTWGQIESVAGDPAKALAHFEEVVKIDPSLVKPMQMLILLMKQQEKFDELIIYMKKFLETYPDRNEVRFQLAGILEKQGALKEAISQMEELERRNEGNETALNDLNGRLALLLYQDGSFAEAEKRLRAALEKLPSNSDIRFMLIRILTDAGELDKAADEYIKPRLEAIKTAGREMLEKYEIHFMLSKVLSSRGLKDAALVHMQKAAELKPEGGLIQIGMGKLLGEKGDMAGCLEHFRKAEKLLPGNHEVAVNIALVLKRTGFYKDAIATLDKDLEANPDQINSLSLLSLILASCPDDTLRSGKRALELARKACELTKNQDPLALQSLAAACAENGLFREAEEKATQAIQIFLAKRNQVLAAYLQKVLRACYNNDKPYRERNPIGDDETPVEKPAPDGQPGKK